MNTCNHENYYYDIFTDREPTKEEINVHRLWKCPDCNKWISLVGHKAT